MVGYNTEEVKKDASEATPSKRLSTEGEPDQESDDE